MPLIWNSCGESSPSIRGTAEAFLPFGPLEELSGFLVPMARRANVPVVIHYDHGLTAEKCVEAKLGRRGRGRSARFPVSSVPPNSRYRRSFLSAIARLPPEQIVNMRTK